MELRIPRRVVLDTYINALHSLESEIVRSAVILGIDVDTLDLDTWSLEAQEVVEQHKPLLEIFANTLEKYKLTLAKVAELEEELNVN